VERASCFTLARNARSCGRDLPWGTDLIATSRSDVHRGGRHQTGSRRAATGARKDPKTCHQTVTDRDRDSTRRESQPGVSHASSPVLNTTRFLAQRPSADLARRKPGVQIPSPPPPNLQVRPSPTSSGRRSPPSGSALGPRTPMGGYSTSAWERLPKLVDRQSNPSLDSVQRPALLAAQRPY
jgi:hypothetical protein